MSWWGAYSMSNVEMATVLALVLQPSWRCTLFSFMGKYWATANNQPSSTNVIEFSIHCELCFSVDREVLEVEDHEASLPCAGHRAEAEPHFET